MKLKEFRLLMMNIELLEYLDDVSLEQDSNCLYFHGCVDFLQGEQGERGQPGVRGPTGPPVSVVLYCSLE